MPITTTSTFTCDRDGTASEPSAGMPAGWSTVQFATTTEAPAPMTGTMPMSASLILCPNCTAAFRAFRETPGAKEQTP